jgi:hypothetical protein
MSDETKNTDATDAQEGTPDIKVLSPIKVTFDDKKTLLVGINSADLDLSEVKVIAEERGLTPKVEQHVTVIGFKNGRAVDEALNRLPEEDRATRLSELTRLANETNWGFTLAPERYQIAKDYSVYKDGKPTGETEHRTSIIQIVNMPGMAIFYEGLNKTLGTNLEAPPAHTTLFTGGSDPEKSERGIGINTSVELQAMNPELITK